MGLESGSIDAKRLAKLVFVCKFGFGTAENEHPKVWYTYLTLDNYTTWLEACTGSTNIQRKSSAREQWAFITAIYASVSS